MADDAFDGGLVDLHGGEVEGAFGEALSGALGGVSDEVEQLEEEAEAFEGVGFGDLFDEGECFVGGGAGDAQAVCGEGAEMLEGVGFWKLPDGVAGFEAELEGVAGGFFEAAPVVWDVGADEDDIERLERGDVIADEAGAAAALDDGEFHLWVVVPAVADAGDAGGVGGGEDGVDFAEVIAPVEESEGLLGVEMDGFLRDRHVGLFSQIGE